MSAFESLFYFHVVVCNKHFIYAGTCSIFFLSENRGMYATKNTTDTQAAQYQCQHNILSHRFPYQNDKLIQKQVTGTICCTYIQNSAMLHIWCG